MRIVDAHIHPDFAVVDQIPPELMAQEMLAKMDPFGVSVSGILGVVDPKQDAESVRRVNNYTAKTVAAAPERLYGLVFMNPNLDDGFVAEELDRCLEMPEFRGIKLEFDLNCRSSRMRVLMERAIAHAVPILHHSWYVNLWDYPTPERQSERSEAHDIAALARDYPEARILMAHLEGSGLRGVRDIENVPNIWVDTSGSQPFTGTLEYALDVLGADRILYGSDLFGRSLHSQLGRIFGAKMSDDERQQILWRNATSLFNLGDLAIEDRQIDGKLGGIF